MENRQCQSVNPIADLLTRIRNANSAHHDTLEVSASKLKVEVVKILLDEGYIKSYELISQPVQDKIKVTPQVRRPNARAGHYKPEACQQAGPPSLPVPTTNSPPFCAA